MSYKYPEAAPAPNSPKPPFDRWPEWALGLLVAVAVTAIVVLLLVVLPLYMS